MRYQADVNASVAQDFLKVWVYVLRQVWFTMQMKEACDDRARVLFA